MAQLDLLHAVTAQPLASASNPLLSLSGAIDAVFPLEMPADDGENEIAMAASGTPKHNGKSATAYKTISEVSDELDVPQHVLRFWESHFPQVKPSRMRGARRYYRPEDVDTLKRIKTLLYKQGYTIKGAKKIVRGKSPEAEEATPALAFMSAQEKMEPVITQDAFASEKPAATPKPDIQFLLSELKSLKMMLQDVTAVK